MVIKSNVLLSCVVCVHARASEGAESLVWSLFFFFFGAKTHDKDLKNVFCNHRVANFQLNCGRRKTTANRRWASRMCRRTRQLITTLTCTHETMLFREIRLGRGKGKKKKKKKKIRVFACTVIKLPNPYFKWIGEMWLCSLEIFSETVSPTQWEECNDSEHSFCSDSLKQQPVEVWDLTCSCWFSLSFNWILGVILNPIINDRHFSPHPALLSEHYSPRNRWILLLEIVMTFKHAYLLSCQVLNEKINTTLVCVN